MTPERLAVIAMEFERAPVYTRQPYVPELIAAVRELQTQIKAFKEGRYGVIFHADGKEEWIWEK
jgi:hypothetical protein